ncbi:gamma-glutamyltransferase [Lacicoccus alkaliphilus]|uniref:Glutathione hydrolase proenzyme n=1 Tax=Lacicoccus alkaliphilus DSM 16010 TaxID=1123231 RepID=A0A1M7JLD2_9BACL|nr:gamma-glutamyltransferase [Salinicoccus alkaliphilus]SHM53563.1 gamma-glutamyltranspeptidase / glutathione hydrolase [Salinicoccus alkaliphilus DSM 16010]
MKSFLSRFSMIFAVTLLTVVTVSQGALASSFEPDYGTENNIATGDDGMVVSAHPLASEVGLDILNSGGNAVDAAIAMQYALTVTEPMMSGIGGGGFMMVYDAATGETKIINSRERAPAGADPEMFLDDDGEPMEFQDRVIHGNSVGVPGTAKGLETSHEMWGTMAMHDLIAPAVALAEEGFPIDDFLERQIEEHAEKLERSAAGEVFFSDGNPLAEGDMLVQGDLANTLRMISEQGTDVLYHGEIAAAVADTVQEFEGSLAVADMQNYDVTIDEPVWGQYKDYDIATMPPPSSGGIFLLQMLGILDGFDLGQYDIKSVEKYHLLAETMHLAYADRAEYAGDPEFVDVPVEGLLHPDYIAERRNLISLDSVIEEPEAGDVMPYQQDFERQGAVEQPDDKVDGQTTHYSVIDSHGNVVSYTTTIEQVFGSGIMVPGYGFLLNNELTDFDAEPGGANEVQPNKRPLSSMTPTIVFNDGHPVLTVGSPGGQTIITSVLQTILNTYEYGLPLEEALNEPRIFTNNPDNYSHEEGIPEEVIQQLNDMGHGFTEEPSPIGNVNSIMFNPEDGTYTGATDENRNGAAFGFELEAVQ